MKKSFPLASFSLIIISIAIVLLISIFYYSGKVSLIFLLVAAVICVFIISLKKIYSIDQTQKTLSIFYEIFFFLKLNETKLTPINIVRVDKSLARMRISWKSSKTVKEHSHELLIYENNNETPDYRISGYENKINDLSIFFSEGLNIEIKTDKLIVDNVFYHDKNVKINLGSVEEETATKSD